MPVVARHPHTVEPEPDDIRSPVACNIREQARVVPRPVDSCPAHMAFPVIPAASVWSAAHSTVSPAIYLSTRLRHSI